MRCHKNYVSQLFELLQLAQVAPHKKKDWYMKQGGEEKITLLNV